MRSLSLLIFLVFLATVAYSQSPHGDLKGVDCSSCHNPENWSIDTKSLNYDHSKTGFPLVGQHQNADCQACHTTLKFEGTPENCVSCHTTVHANTISTDCQTCHTPSGWGVKDVLPLHERSRFPLFGAHQTADCGQCHKNYEVRQFEPVQTDCFSCHSQDYYATVAPNHPMNKFSKDCSTCHDTRAINWRSQNIDHSFFPLTGGHSKPGCFDCHSSASFAGLSQDCYSCHRPDYEATLNPNHVAGNFSKDCKTCHTINGWVPASFDHNLTAFPLTGRHTTVNCASCHTQGYAGTPKECVSCHQTDYSSTTNPNHTAAGFPNTCETCHTTAGWTPAQFDHDGPFFPIYSGSHRNQWNACGDCHTNSSNYQLFSCTTCHEHNQADMNQEHQGIQGYRWESSACLSCHPDGNAEGAFNHSTSQFPLTGSHLTMECSGCHTSGYTTQPPLDCYSCHQSGYQQTTKLNHALAGFSQDCTECHNTTAWATTSFNHAIYAGFTLQNSHANKTCVQCHETTYSGTSGQCSSCHLSDYQLAQDPNHVAGNYSQVCSQCHTDIGWSPATFDHTIVNFPLTGRHTTTQCADCHTTGWSNTPNQCNGCHLTDYQNAQNPNHIGAQFPQTCQDCHTSVGWTPATFDHDGQYFPINSGKHRNEWNNDCRSCHEVSSNYAVFTCVSCHEHNRTDMDQEHQGVQGYIYASSECFACHPDGTSDGAFNHTTSNFPLTGNHVTLNCSQCHTSGYTNTSNECISCHQSGFNQTNKLNHTLAGFSQNCTECHNTSGWTQTTFDHTVTTGFALQNSHSVQTCVQCHETTYSGTENVCQSCHLQDFQGTTNPNHVTGNYPQVCANCHTDIGWAPATFDHTIVGYQLTGKHTTVPCAQCHTTGYTGTSEVCESCHLDDYNAATNPNHAAPNFPKVCDECHTTTAWRPSTFNHDQQYFPIYSGEHRNEWNNNCLTCHTVPGNFTSFSCINCHEHNQTSMAQEHQGVANYQWNSQRCFDCHPDGESRPAKKNDHGAYLISGKHASVTCNECHTGNNSQPQCLNCHQEEFTIAHKLQRVNTNCWECHTTFSFNINGNIPRKLERVD